MFQSNYCCLMYTIYLKHWVISPQNSFFYKSLWIEYYYYYKVEFYEVSSSKSSFNRPPDVKFDHKLDQGSVSRTETWFQTLCFLTQLVCANKCDMRKPTLPNLPWDCGSGLGRALAFLSASFSHTKICQDSWVRPDIIQTSKADPFCIFQLQ